MAKINSFRKEFYYLSNFYEIPVTYNGLTFVVSRRDMTQPQQSYRSYQNNEAAFQAQKTLDEKERMSFTRMNPSEAKHAGRRITLRKDWEAVKVGIMHDIVEAKFRQNPSLAAKLIGTGNVYLEEGKAMLFLRKSTAGNTQGDRAWGSQCPVDIGFEPTGVKRRPVDGKGANNLGRILMDIRQTLHQEMNLDKEGEDYERQS